MTPPHQPPPVPLEEILAAQIQAFQSPYRYYRVAANRFLAYLQTDFPHVRDLSDLRRDPHLLGWIRRLCQEDPPLSPFTRRIYVTGLRRLLRDLAPEGQPRLILPEDFPPPPAQPPTVPKKDRRPQTEPDGLNESLCRPDPLHPRLNRAQDFPRRLSKKRAQLSDFRFGELLDTRIQTLATTLRPGTIAGYRVTARCFLSYLQTDFPHVQQLAELRRDPHLFGWFRHLCQHEPSLSNSTRQTHLLQLRRLFEDLACAGHPLQPGLILTEDLPPRPQYLPRALSCEDDQRLQQELRRRNDLLSHALLLTRATGLRIGECIGLAANCLPSLGPDQWALQVPLGKLRTERLVPIDQHIRQMIDRILTLREQAPASQLPQSAHFLLPRSRPSSLYRHLRAALHQAAQRSGCSDRVTPHRLRHTYATEMVRLGVSLPAVMQLLGHKDIRMTLRYVQVTQRDLQREFHLARQNAVSHHQIPELSHVFHSSSVNADLAGVRHALASTRHLLEMYRRQLHNEKARHKLQRLDKRLLNVAFELDRLGTAEK